MTQLPVLTFFIHPKFWPQGDIPDSPDVAWSGFNFGVYTWTIQTYLRLSGLGVPCKLTSDLPEEGIVFAHRECLEVNGHRILPTRTRFLVNLAADLPLFPAANIQIVQNPAQPLWYRNCFYLPHWPEPGMTREPNWDRFENIAYFGNGKNLAPELRDEVWKATVEELGLHWMTKTGTFQYDDPSSYGLGGVWSDYSFADAIVAVRRFSSTPKFDHKPASKLINAWAMGLPAILGCESAYRHIRRSDLDYIEVKDVASATEALKQLKGDPDLRLRMRENGFLRMKEFLPDKIAESWLELIETEIVPRYLKWLETPRVGQLLKVTFRTELDPVFAIARKKLLKRRFEEIKPVA